MATIADRAAATLRDFELEAADDPSLVADAAAPEVCVNGILVCKQIQK